MRALRIALPPPICATAPAGAEVEDEYRLQENIPYRNGDDLDTYQKERCRLDLYSPTDGRDLATIIWFHGAASVKASAPSPPL